MKNTFKPKEEKGKGLNTAFCDEIKDEIKKRGAVGCKLTRDELNLFEKAKGILTNTAYLRSLIMEDLTKKGLL